MGGWVVGWVGGWVGAGSTRAGCAKARGAAPRTPRPRPPRPRRGPGLRGPRRQDRPPRTSTCSAKRCVRWNLPNPGQAGPTGLVRPHCGQTRSVLAPGRQDLHAPRRGQKKVFYSSRNGAVWGRRKCLGSTLVCAIKNMGYGICVLWQRSGLHGKTPIYYDPSFACGFHIAPVRPPSSSC